MISHKMVVNVDMFGAGMQHRVGSQISGTKIVTPQDRRRTENNAKITKKRLQPEQLTGGVSHCLVFGLGARPGNNGLFPRRPRDEMRAEKNTQATSGAAII